MKILVHACCGPCSIEPARILRNEGHEVCLAFMNPNIAPYEEYAHRLEEFIRFCQMDGFDCVELDYDEARYEQSVAKEHKEYRSKRCKACYSLRLNDVAAYASTHGYEALSSTLSVSPYQYGDLIKDALEKAANTYNLKALYRDFTSEYEASVVDSRELGLYRQNYCGCRFSAVEAEKDRVLTKRKRHVQKALERAYKRLK